MKPRIIKHPKINSSVRQLVGKFSKALSLSKPKISIYFGRSETVFVG